MRTKAVMRAWVALSVVLGTLNASAGEPSPSTSTPTSTSTPPRGPAPTPVGPDPVVSPEDAALAERMFVEGRVWAARGDQAAACARFDASRKLDPRAIGTVLNLALCSEQLAHFASAAKWFRDVIARDKRPERVEFAKQHLAVVEPKISKLTVKVPPEALETELTITVDGTPLEKDAWDWAGPIDGGTHVIEAHAPGKRSFRGEIAIDSDAGSGTISIPPLPVLPPPPKQSQTGWVVGAAGVAVLGVGLGLGASVASECGGLLRNTCKALDDSSDAEAPSKERSLRTREIIASIASGVGVVGIGVGIYLLATRPTLAPVAPITGFRFTPLLIGSVDRATGGGVTAHGSF